MPQRSKAQTALLLGKMYMTGFAFPANEVQARRWLRASAEQGDAEAQFFLGAMDLASRRDIAEALRWLKRSAEQGLPESQLLLGVAYMKGDAARHDLVEADKWLHLAAAHGDQIAATQRQLAESQMTPEQIAKARVLAMQWKPKVTTPAPQ